MLSISTLYDTQRCLTQPLCYNQYLPSDSSRVGCFTTSPGLFISPYSNDKGSFFLVKATSCRQGSVGTFLFEVKLKEEDLSSLS